VNLSNFNFELGQFLFSKWKNNPLNTNPMESDFVNYQNSEKRMFFLLVGSMQK